MRAALKSRPKSPDTDGATETGRFLTWRIAMTPPTPTGKPAETAPTTAPGNPAAPDAKANKQSRRQKRRMAHRVPCRVRLVDPITGEIRTIAGETVNLSPDGMALHVGVEVPLGTWVETLVPHAQSDPLFLCGEVVRIRRTLAANFEIGVSMKDDAPPLIP